MPIINLIPFRNDQTCSISEDGTFNFPQPILNKLGWSLGEKIAISYIDVPLTVLLRTANPEHPGYTLSAINSIYRYQSGGKLKCRSFVKQILRSRISLPARGIQPVFLPRSKYQLVFVLQTPNWVYEEFSQIGCQNISLEKKGVYELLSWEHEIIRIGEGLIASRTRCRGSKPHGHISGVNRRSGVK